MQRSFYYGLAVKTGSIALQKFFFLFFFSFFFFLGLRAKFGFLGSTYFFPDLSQKTNGTINPI